MCIKVGDIINRQLKRNKDKLKDYVSKIDTLSKHGYEAIGYLKGMIRMQEYIELLLRLETFNEYCSRIKEEHPNAPWEDETVESLHKMYVFEKTWVK